ncbi:MAG: hypothetical protein OEM59_02835 [Rhodospirillales bacterium]|nr:hypothetical protein [Rhodospirillales bacterium]
MTPDDRRDAPENHSYQEELARNLMECLGREGAIHACQANGWDGVLNFLLPKGREG